MFAKRESQGRISTRAVVSVFDWAYSQWAANLLQNVQKHFDVCVCITVNTPVHRANLCDRVIEWSNASVVGVPTHSSSWSHPHWAKLLLFGHEFRQYEVVWLLDAYQMVLPHVPIVFPRVKRAVTLIHDTDDSTGRYREFRLIYNPREKMCDNGTLLKQNLPLHHDLHGVYLSNVISVRPSRLAPPMEYLQRTRKFFEVYGTHCNRMHDQTLIHFLFWDAFGSIRQPPWLRHFFHVRCVKDSDGFCRTKP